MDEFDSQLGQIDQQYGKGGSVPSEKPVAAAQPQAQPHAQAAPTANDPFSAIDQQYGNGKTAVADKPESQSTFMDGVEGFNRAFGKFAENTLSLIPGLKSKIDPYQKQMDTSAAEAQERSPWAYGLSNLAGGIGLGTMVGGPLAARSMATTAAQKMAAYGGISGALGYLGAGGDQDNRINNAFISAGVGAAMPPVMNAIGSAANYIAPNIKNAGLLSKTAITGAAGAGAGYYAADDNNKLEGSILGGLAGAAIPGLVAGTGAVGRYLLPKIGHSNFIQREIDPKGTATNDLIESIKGKEGSYENVAAKVTQAQQDMQNTGIKVGPGEVFPETAGVDIRKYKPDDVERDTQVKPAYWDMANKVKDQFFGIVNKMSNSAIRKEAKNKLKELEGQYSTADGQFTDDPVKAAIPDFIAKDPILTEKYQDVVQSPYAKWRDLPTNSLAQLHKVKVSLDDEIFKSTPNKMGVTTNPLSVDKMGALQDSLNKINSYLKQDPNYDQAMKLSQQSKIQDTYNNILEMAKHPQNSEDGLTPLSLKNALLDNNKNQAQFIKDVITTGGDPEKAKSVINILSGVAMSPLKKIINASYTGDGNYQRLYDRGDKFAQSVMSRLANARYYKAALQLAVSDHWTDDVMKAISQKTLAAQKTGLLSVLSQALSSGTQVAVPLRAANMINPQQPPQQAPAQQ